MSDHGGCIGNLTVTFMHIDANLVRAQLNISESCGSCLSRQDRTSNPVVKFGGVVEARTRRSLYRVSCIWIAGTPDFAAHLSQPPRSLESLLDADLRLQTAKTRSPKLNHTPFVGAIMSSVQNPCAGSRMAQGYKEASDRGWCWSGRYSLRRQIVPS